MRFFIQLLVITVYNFSAPGPSSLVKQLKDYRFKLFWKGIILTESSGRHFKRGKVLQGPKGELGMAQIMPSTFALVLQVSKRKDLSFSGIYKKSINLWAGKYYFSNSFYGYNRQDEMMAVISYNRGWTNKKREMKYYNKVVNNIRRK